MFSLRFQRCTGRCLQCRIAQYSCDAMAFILEYLHTFVCNLTNSTILVKRLLTGRNLSCAYWIPFTCRMQLLSVFVLIFSTSSEHYCWDVEPYKSSSLEPAYVYSSTNSFQFNLYSSLAVIVSLIVIILRVLDENANIFSKHLFFGSFHVLYDCFWSIRCGLS